MLTLVDITERRRAILAKEYAESIVETLHEPLLVLTPELTVKSANRAFCSHFNVSREQTIDRQIYDLGNGQWDIPSLRKLLEEVLPENNVFNDYQVIHEFEHLGRRVMLLNARRLDHVQLILLSIRDVTEAHDAERGVQESHERLQRMVNVEGVGVLILDQQDGRLLEANDAFLHMAGYRREEVRSGTLDWRALTAPEHIEASRAHMQRLQETGRIGPYRKEYIRKDGSRSWMVCAGASLGDGTFIEYCIDVGERKRGEQALRESE